MLSEFDSVLNVFVFDLQLTFDTLFNVEFLKVYHDVTRLHGVNLL